MNEKRLTIKQERFAVLFVELGDASAAYRQAYDAENMLPTTINRKAKDVRDHPTVAARISELQGRFQVGHGSTVDSLVAELEAARKAAMEADTPQVSAAVSAIMGKAKLLGLLVNKNEIAGKGGGPIKFSSGIRSLTDSELESLVRTGQGKAEPKRNLN